MLRPLMTLRHQIVHLPVWLLLFGVCNGQAQKNTKTRKKVSLNDQCFKKTEDLYSAVDEYMEFGQSSYGPIETWCVSKIKSFYQVFSAYRDPSLIDFNADISQWDVSGARDMNEMFRGNLAFDQDLSHWDVSRVKEMRFMFAGAESFDGDIVGWDIKSLKDATGMFRGALVFNQDLSGWQTTKLEMLGGMFEDASSYKQNLCSWADNLSTNADVGGLFLGSGCPIQNDPDLEAGDSFCRSCGITRRPTVSPTNFPSRTPTSSPTKFPTGSPTEIPTKNPSTAQTASPSTGPTSTPTNKPSSSPTDSPSITPSGAPTRVQSIGPSAPGRPSNGPSFSPSSSPSKENSSHLEAVSARAAFDIGFFSGAREPVEKEVLALLHEAATNFYRARLPEFFSGLVDVETELVDFKFESNNIAPVHIDFEAKASFAEGDAPTPEELLEVLLTEDYRAFVTQFVWYVEPFLQSLWFEVNQIGFSAWVATSAPSPAPQTTLPANEPTMADTVDLTMAASFEPTPSDTFLDQPVDSIAVITKASVDIGFFSKVEKPTQEDMEQLLREAATPFFAFALSENFPDLVGVELVFIASNFDINQRLPAQIDFEVRGYFSKFGEVPLPNEIVTTMIEANYQNFITDFLWNKESFDGSLWSEVSFVAAKNWEAPRPSVSPTFMPSLLPTSTPTARSTTAPSRKPSVPPSPEPVEINVVNIITSLVFGFFADVGQPSQEEILALLEKAATPFYLHVLSASFSNFVDIDTTLLSFNYDENRRLPVHVNFNVNAYFKDDGSVPSEGKIFFVMEKADYFEFITNHLWEMEESEPFWFEASFVRFGAGLIEKLPQKIPLVLPPSTPKPSDVLTASPSAGTPTTATPTTGTPTTASPMTMSPTNDNPFDIPKLSMAQVHEAFNEIEDEPTSGAIVAESSLEIGFFFDLGKPAISEVEALLTQAATPFFYRVLKRAFPSLLVCEATLKDYLYDETEARPVRLEIAISSQFSLDHVPPPEAIVEETLRADYLVFITNYAWRVEPWGSSVWWGVNSVGFGAGVDTAASHAAVSTSDAFLHHQVEGNF